MQKLWETYNKQIQFGLIVLATFICFRYLFVYISPFIIAYLLCRAIYPCADFIHRRLRIPVMLGCYGILALAAALLGIMLYYGLCGLGKNIVPFCQNMKVYLVILEQRFCDCCCVLEQKFQMREGILLQTVQTGWGALRDGFSNKWMPDMLQTSVGYIKAAVSVGAYLIVIIVATILMLRQWEHYKSSLHQKMQKMCGDFLSFVGIYLWAEIRIMSAVGLTCFLGLWAAHIRNAPALAVLTAFLDMLPFIGTGIVLLPVLIWQLLNQRFTAAAIVGVTYVLCVLVREFLEPKLISEKAGLSPLLTLAGIYAGVYLFGLAGIFLGPVFVLIITLVYRQMFCNS